jgi:delta 1-pyrroline-5-carboxylate dehydrogenase
MCGVGDGGRLKDDVGPVTDDDATDAFCQEARSTSELYLDATGVLKPLFLNLNQARAL